MVFYTMRHDWVVDKNFFANVFIPGLYSLVESGIYRRWCINSLIIKPQMYFQYREMGRQKNKSKLKLQLVMGVL